MEQESSIISKELKEMYDTDQSDRSDYYVGGIDWEVVKSRDLVRITRVEELYSQGLLQTPNDMYYAAMIYQHGYVTEHYQKAMELSKEAGKLGHSDGKRLSALAEDRYLLSIGKAQVWGTQFSRRATNESWKLIEPFDRIAKTDEERRAMGLISIEEKLKNLNSRK